MGVNSVSDSDYEKSAKKHKNDSDVSCWNCFTSEDSDREVEPVPLPKIREEQREKLKLYAFLASEISKPKAVSLKQKIGEQYATTKKIDEKIGKGTDPAKYKEEIQNHFENVYDTSYEASPSKSSKSEFNRNSTDPVEYSEEFKSHYENVSGISDTPYEASPAKSNQSSFNRDYDRSMRRKIKALISAEEKEEAELLKRRMSSAKPILQKQHATDVYTTANKVGVAITKNKLSQSLQEKVFSPRTPEMNRSAGQSNIKEEITKFSKRLSFTSPSKTSKSIDSLNIIKDKRRMSLGNENSLMQSRSSSLKKIDDDVPTQRLSVKQMVMAREKLSRDNANQSKSLDDDFNNVGVLYKVQIETSTPKKIKSTISLEQDEVNDDIKSAKSENSSNADHEEITPKEKFDNASSNGSESGYAGSSATVQDVAENMNNDLSEKIESLSEQMEKLSVREPFKSSLPALNKVEKKILKMPSTSLASDINTAHVKSPPKSIRWSTMALPTPSYSIEDESYISDSLSPGHATLPRRSSSPLPHDADRDRFSLNRSGLQARSESMASVYSGAGEGMRGSVTVKGEVQFSLLYNYRLGALEVGVKRCRDLAPIDVKRNRSDPYVKVYLLPDKSKAGKRKTKVKKNTLNPVFEETLSFAQPLATLSARTLWLSVWHADMFGRNDFLGEVALPLADVVFDDPAPMWYKLHERTEQFDEQQGTRGDIIIGLKFELLESNAARGKGTLHVLVKEAKNLVATKPNGLADVFCKSYLLPERGRLAKQKTGVARRTLNPRWEHTFTYRGLTLNDLATRALELSLWDRDRLASNDFMGAVRLSLGTGTYMGANVNWMDSVGKELSLWQTMMQRPNFWVEGSLPLRPQLNHRD